MLLSFLAFSLTQWDVLDVQPRRALWVWMTDFLTDSDFEDLLFAFCRNKSIRVLFLSAYTDTLKNHYDDYAKVIKRAHQLGMRVHALTGDPNWILEPENLYENLREVLKYNSSRSDPLERFDGFHDDTEPNGLGGWSWSGNDVTKKYMRKYLELLDMSNLIIQQSGQDLLHGVAMNMQFDSPSLVVDYRGETKGFYQHIMDRVDYVAIMAYRDDARDEPPNGWKDEDGDGVIERTVNEVAYGDYIGRWVMVGQETGPYGDKVSYWEESPDVMEEQISQVQDSTYGFGDNLSFARIACHDFRYYFRLWFGDEPQIYLSNGGTVPTDSSYFVNLTSDSSAFDEHFYVVSPKFVPVADPQPEITWVDEDNFGTYKVILSESPHIDPQESGYLYEEIVNTKSWSPPSPLASPGEYKKFYLQVFQWNGTHAVKRSQQVFFEIDRVPPSPVEIISPPEGTVTISRYPQFIWTASPDEDFRNYEMWVDGVLLSNITDIGTTVYIPDFPLSKGEHIWYLKIYDYVGNVWVSSAYHFNITDVPVYPEPFFPVNTTVYSPSPYFKWNFVSSYQGPFSILIDDDPDVDSEPIINETCDATTWSPPTPLEVFSGNKRLYWKVGYWDGSTWCYSRVVSFVVSQKFSVIVDNFDSQFQYNEQHYNDLGGWTDDDNTLTEDVVTADGCLKLTWNTSVGSSYLGWYWYSVLKPEGMDLTPFSKLFLRVKGASGGENFKFVLVDVNKNTAGIWASSCVPGGVSTDWKEVFIDLSAFRDANPSLDMTHVQAVSVAFYKNYGTQAGTIYLDDIRILKGFPVKLTSIEPGEGSVYKPSSEVRILVTGQNWLEYRSGLVVLLQITSEDGSYVSPWIRMQDEGDGYFSYIWNTQGFKEGKYYIEVKAAWGGVYDLKPDPGSWNSVFADVDGVKSGYDSYIVLKSGGSASITTRKLSLKVGELRAAPTFLHPGDILYLYLGVDEDYGGAEMVVYDMNSKIVLKSTVSGELIYNDLVKISYRLPSDMLPGVYVVRLFVVSSGNKGVLRRTRVSKFVVY